MKQRLVLVVEDDAAIRLGIVDALTLAGYSTLETARGDEGLALAVGSDCDLLLLDLVLPGRDGLEVLRQARIERPALPIIILTARAAENDRVRGLRMGADDYVVKPFSLHELLARVEAVLRRSADRPAGARQFQFAAGDADLITGEIRFADGRRTQLSDRENQLLRYMAHRCGQTVTREELLARVWGIDPAGLETRTIDMHIARLREKLGDDAHAPRVLVTVRGKGYRLAMAAPAL